jgi:hypothetical protein
VVLPHLAASPAGRGTAAAADWVRARCSPPRPPASTAMRRRWPRPSARPPTSPPARVVGGKTGRWLWLWLFVVRCGWLAGCWWPALGPLAHWSQVPPPIQPSRAQPAQSTQATPIQADWGGGGGGGRAMAASHNTVVASMPVHPEMSSSCICSSSTRQLKSRIAAHILRDQQCHKLCPCQLSKHRQIVRPLVAWN